MATRLTYILGGMPIRFTSDDRGIFSEDDQTRIRYIASRFLAHVLLSGHRDYHITRVIKPRLSQMTEAEIEDYIAWRERHCPETMKRHGWIEGEG